MQDMVKRIVEMDKHARELTDEANRLKVGSEDHLNEKKEELRQKYDEKVKQRLELIRKAEAAAAEDEMKAVIERQQQLEAQLQAAYEQNGDAWVNQIVARVTGDDK